MWIHVHVRCLQDKGDPLALLPELHPNQDTAEMYLNDPRLSQDITQKKRGGIELRSYTLAILPHPQRAGMK